MTKEDKQQAIDILREQTAAHVNQLCDIEPRLLEYYQHLCEHSGTELGDPNDLHNGNELLCAIRLLRLIDTYPLNREKIDEVIYMGEGEWRQDSDGFWTHIEGGLGQPGRHGAEVYRWEPFQMFMIVAMYGPMAWISTETQAGTRRLTETERVNPDTNEIEDLRRLCTRFVLYGPRKINKSGFAAITNVEDFMFGDYDAQVVCTANSQEQSKILFNKTKDLLIQLDPVTGRKFNGKYLSYTATEVKFMKGKYRAAELIAIPAGGKMPDGKFASRSAEDEYGSAGYTNGRSDMGQTAAVIESSMGPRREPMTVITTTASLITAGPFMEMLDALHRLLLEELKYATGEATPSKAEDRQMCLLLEPDEWEREEDYLLTSKTVRRKINPMLGKIVQHSFYDDECAKSRMDETKKKETISKLFNVYQSGKMTDWIKPDEIRAIQVPMRIDECTRSQGWEVMVGMDFSKGDDLNGCSYLAKRWRDDLGEYEYFADMDAYMSEVAVEESPIRELLLKWSQAGWLHIVPGRTFDPAVVMDRIVELDDKDINVFGYGYDPYNAKTVINALTQWLVDVGLDPKQLIKPVRQNFATYSPAVKEFDYFIHRDLMLPDGQVAPNPMIHLSSNPLWPWEFGNCQLAESTDGMENMKPIKANASASCKVDNVQMLLSALILHDMADGSIQPT
jgi:phage terminase large subunit-like protein